jgi:hypothetical protein
MSRLPQELRSRFLKTEVWGYIEHDQKPAEYVVFDPQCAADQIHLVNGFLVIPHVMAKRLPDPTRIITLPGQRAQGGWKLTDLGEGTQQADA